MLPYAAMMLFLNLLVYGFANFALLAGIGLGVLAGIGGLVVFYNHFSSWHTFVEIVLPFTGVGAVTPGGALTLHDRIFGERFGAENLFTSFFGNPTRFLDQKTLFDYSAFLLFIIALILAKKIWRAAAATDKKFMAYVLIVAIVVPPFMHVAGHYRSMYRWMTYIPLAIATPRFLEIHRAAGGGFAARAVAMLVILFSLCIGLPFRTLAVIPGWRERSVKPIDEVAAHVTRPSDVVICDFKVYFAERPHARLLYGYGLPASGDFRLTTDLPANDVSLLCLEPEHLQPVLDAVGGKWKKLDLHDVPGADALTQTRYAVDFYRRETSGEMKPSK